MEYQVDAAKAEVLSDRLTDRFLKAARSWDDPAKLKELQDRCKAANEKRRK